MNDKLKQTENYETLIAWREVKRKKLFFWTFSSHSHRKTQISRGGLAVGRWTCDLQVAGSIPSRSAYT